ncbi:hypothetical protein FOCC_FOCC013986 [Frankliniella occidentalis]|nr:hypothetical protein FOCC_FOCC013986 [Frankliniella occidentalis]
MSSRHRWTICASDRTLVCNLYAILPADMQRPLADLAKPIGRRSPTYFLKREILEGRPYQSVAVAESETVTATREHRPDSRALDPGAASASSVCSS